MQYPKAFIAGFISTLVFHQGVYALFWLAGVLPSAPYAMAPTSPFGLPAVISLAFWGGVWGIPVWWFIRDANAWNYWLRAVLLGAIGPSAVALFAVFPLKGMAFAAGWDPAIIVGALILNGAWGFGVALLMQLARVRDQK
ncbi:MAG: hypothetical protein H0W33_00235 [Gammaproteobacteria bacterium]|nr:hypothetical protein [Gammaproteobacteria bacterium]